MAEEIEQLYRIHTDEYNYMLKLKKHSDLSITLQLGSRTKPDCITIKLNATGPLRNIAQLPFVKREDDCAIDKKLESGEHLIKTALRFIKQYDYIDYVSLDDYSHITCNNKRDLPLSYFYFVQYQQTWYEKKFGAMLKLEDDRNEYDKIKKYWLDPSVKIPVDRFLYNLEMWKIPREKIDILASYYKVTSTYKEFCDLLFIKESKSNACSLLQYWIDKHFNSEFDFTLENKKWLIPMKSAPSIQIKSFERMAGGFNFKYTKIKKNSRKTNFTWKDLTTK